MKKLILTLTAVASLTLVGLTGCSKTESGAATIDTAKVQAVFSAASAVDKAEVEKAITAVKAGDYSSALTSLKSAAANVKLTPEQQQAVKDLLAQVQAKLATATGDVLDKAKTAAGDAAKQGGDAAGKTVGDLKKAVGK